MMQTVQRQSTMPSNPFATRFVRPGAMRYHFALGESETEAHRRYRELVRDLVAKGAGLIVGPHGSGKSTLLRSLDSALAAQFDDRSQIDVAQHIVLNENSSKWNLLRFDLLTH